MNRDDIIRMARDSGMELYGLGKDREKFVYYLQEFAALVAAAEREACANLCDKASNHWWSIASSNRKDREIEPAIGITAVQAASRIRDAIRARGVTDAET